ncbi:LysR substrate-binding domain-containing protein [Vibrio sp. AK197]
MSKRLPPLQGVYYFYMAAQQGSFKLAAQKLFVTPAAVSQQIRQLEEWLGVDLFTRHHREIRLTHEGQTLYRQAEKGFSYIQDGIRLINQDPTPNQLSISTVPSFAQHWLVPRIRQFREQYPDLAMLIEPTDQLVKFQDSSIDLCIRYGRGEYDNLESEWLMDEVLYPVCNPIYQKEKQIYRLEDLSKADLLEDIWPDIDWHTWLDNVGIMHNDRSTMRYNGSLYVLEGALSLQGVALVKHSIVQRYLKEEKLVRIGDVAIKPHFGYYACAPKGYFKREKVIQFMHWMKREIAQFQQSSPCDFMTLEASYARESP